MAKTRWGGMDFQRRIQSAEVVYILVKSYVMSELMVTNNDWSVPGRHEMRKNGSMVGQRRRRWPTIDPFLWRILGGTSMALLTMTWGESPPYAEMTCQRPTNDSGYRIGSSQWMWRIAPTLAQFWFSGLDGCQHWANLCLEAEEINIAAAQIIALNL